MRRNVKREDGRWEGRIVVGHKENGEPIFQYVLTPTQKVLLAKLYQNIEIFRDVELCEDSRMTLAQWLDRWLDDYAAPRLRESTMDGYRMYAEQYIKPRLGGKKMTSITTTDIQRMYTKLRKEGRVHEHPEYGHQLSANTVRRIHTMLHRALADAVRAHVIPRNPADGLALPYALNDLPESIFSVYSQRDMALVIGVAGTDDGYGETFLAVLIHQERFTRNFIPGILPIGIG